MGFFIANPRGLGSHEHECRTCSDLWEHDDLGCKAGQDYECPEHQPRSASAYIGDASAKED